MSKNWISFPRVEGRASRQAHADLPDGTYEREIGREGFFGPATHMYHAHMPTAWTSFEGPLRPHAYDTNRLGEGAMSPFSIEPLLANANTRLKLWHVERPMTELVRNIDGDELMFIHAGSGALHCDFGHMTFRDGDYIVLPRGTMWRIEPSSRCSILLIEATDSAYRLPDRGMLGEHAQFDPAILETPHIDDAFLKQQGERPWKVLVKRRGQVSTISYPFTPLDAQGWKGNCVPVRLNWRDIR
ncbi:MAG: homogentisate 1,2-dioxygenase, partial [Alphaproteobacteria bacterium]